MKNNSKKTNKQNTTHASVQVNQSAQTQASGRRVSRRSKDDRRRILFSKKHVKIDKRQMRYSTTGGASYAIARGADLNRRFVAAFLALVFAISCLVVGVNFAARAEVDSDGFNMYESSDSSGFVTRKGLHHNDNGTPKDKTDDTYDLRMEAYATAPIATKAIDTAKTPLDVVFVLNQSESMGTKDVLTGAGYQEAEDVPYTISDIESHEYYYYDSEDEQHYRVSVDHETDAAYAIVEDNNPITTWTAETAYNWETSNSDLFFYNGAEYVPVYEMKTSYYTSTNNKINFLNDNDSNTNWQYTAFGPRQSSTNYYVYVPHDNDTIDGEQSCWHRVYISEEGVAVGGDWTGSSTGGNSDGGYYFTVYYFTNSLEGDTDNVHFSSSDANKKRGDVVGTGDSQVTLLSNFEEMGVYLSINPFNPGYHAISGFQNAFINNTTNGTDGKLYLRSSSNSNTYNVLYTGSSSNPSYLACQNPDTAGSHNYNGNLYAKGYRLYYTKENGTRVDITDAAVVEKTTPAYKKDLEHGKLPLYEKETITRLEAQQRYALKIAEDLATRSTNDVKHRIGVVGFGDDGLVLTDLVYASADDGDDANHVNDIVDDAIDDLDASGAEARRLALGLDSAASVFDGNRLNDGWDRKRIVIVFSDGVPDDTSTTDVFDKGAVLKDTYNAAIYTVGLKDVGSTPDATYVSYMRPLSSEQFRSTTGTDTDKGDGNVYYYMADKQLSSLTEVFNNISSTLQTPYTSVALNDVNAVLKDVISNNFITTNIATEVETATARWSNEGDLSWDTETSSLQAVQNGNTVTVKGFDYNAYYVAEGQEGKKIILTITGLKLKDKVQSDTAKRIFTNDVGSGIYKSNAEDLLFAEFPRPFLDDETIMAPEGGTGHMNADGIVVNKYITPNDNGKYDLTLEAYTTETSQEKMEKVPTDFVVVVDQSGSMSERDIPTGYTPVSGTKYLEDIVNDKNNQYFIQAPDGNYYRVYATRDYLYRYYAPNYWYVGDIVDRLGTDLNWGMPETEMSDEQDFPNLYYFRETDAQGNGVYHPITMSVKGSVLTYYLRFQYTNNAGQVVEFNREDETYVGQNVPWYHNVLNGKTISPGWGIWPINYTNIDGIVQGLYPNDYNYTFSEIEILGAHTGMLVNYPMYDRKVGYTELRYRDVNGVEHTLEAQNGGSTWEFCNANGQATTSQDGSTRPRYSGLYTASGTQTRLQTLKTALTQFANAVAQESDGKTNPVVDNRIAIVGFSSDGYNNTELLTSTDSDFRITTDSQGNYNGIQKSTADAASDNGHWYKSALVSASNGTVGQVNTDITDAIDALGAYGGTQPEDGFKMAEKILRLREEKTYTTQIGDARTMNRNTIVIFFTDGRPGDYEYSNQYSEANEVVEAALPIKQMGTKVFSIGVFGESDGNPLTYSETNLQPPYNNSKYWPYMGGYVGETDSGRLLRRQWRSGAQGYTPSANDTIFDYMSVTSSNYPTATDYIAPAWLSGSFNGDYTAATDGIRGGSVESTVNNHYRMASNQDTLVSAFAQAVTMMNNTLSSTIRLDASAIMRDILKDDSFKASPSTIVKTEAVDGYMDNNGVVWFAESGTPVTLIQAPTMTNGVLSAIDIKGFDYLANYINNGLGEFDQNNGKKLVVTITDVYPDGNDSAPAGATSLVYSNRKNETGNDSSAMIAMPSGSESKVEDFPEPAITRHSYTLNVGDVNTDAVFDVSAYIVDSQGHTVGPNTDDLKDVIIVYPNGERARYRSLGQPEQAFEDMGNGDTFYFENVPANYRIMTSVVTNDDSFVYSISYDDLVTPEQMRKGEAEPHSFGFDNHDIYITSVRSVKDVTIWEQTFGEYSTPSQIFDETITMVIPVSDGDTSTEFLYPVTFTGEYSGYNNETLPKGKTYKAVFEKVGDIQDGKANVKLKAIESYEGNTKVATMPITDSKLPMKHDDRVTISVPTGTKVTVAETDTHGHELNLYSSQDDVDPTTVKLETMSGTPIEGEFNMDFVAINGIPSTSQSIRFNDGLVEGTSSAIDLAPYLSLTFDSDTDLGYPTLNINGNKITFMPENITEGETTTYRYTATIKNVTGSDPVSATVEKDKMDILIVNRKDDVPVTGINDSSSHNWIIYILAAVAGLAAIGAGIFLWKKRNEFVEE